MNQEEAKAELISDLGYEPESIATCSGIAKTCPNDECMVCGIRDCPYNEPLHYHHDGCPACDTLDMVDALNNRSDPHAK